MDIDKICSGLFGENNYTIEFDNDIQGLATEGDFSTKTKPYKINSITTVLTYFELNEITNMFDTHMASVTANTDKRTITIHINNSNTIDDPVFIFRIHPDNTYTGCVDRTLIYDLKHADRDRIQPPSLKYKKLWRKLYIYWAQVPGSESEDPQEALGDLYIMDYFTFLADDLYIMPRDETIDVLGGDSDNSEVSEDSDNDSETEDSDNDSNSEIDE